MFYPDAVQGTAIIPKKYFEKVGLDTFQKKPVAPAVDDDGVFARGQR